MKVYFLETNGNNVVVVAEGRNAKIYDASPSGVYEGVNLYADDAAEQLCKRFAELDEAGELNSFEELGGEAVEIDSNLFNELSEAELVFG